MASMFSFVSSDSSPSTSEKDSDKGKRLRSQASFKSEPSTTLSRAASGGRPSQGALASLPRDGKRLGNLRGRKFDIVERDGTKEEEELFFEAIQRVATFSKLAQSEKKSLAEAMVCIMFNQNEHITWEGDPADALYVLVDGSVEVRERESAEILSVSAQEGHPGGSDTCFGVKAMVTGEMYSKQVVVTSEDGAKVFMLERISFIKKLGPKSRWLEVDSSDESSSDNDGVFQHLSSGGYVSEQQDKTHEGRRKEPSRTEDDLNPQQKAAEKFNSFLWSLGMSSEQLHKGNMEDTRAINEQVKSWSTRRKTVFQVIQNESFEAASSAVIAIYVLALSVLLSNEPGEAITSSIIIHLYKVIFIAEVSLRVVSTPLFMKRGRMLFWEIALAVIGVVEGVLWCIPDSDELYRVVYLLASLQSLRLFRLLVFAKNVPVLEDAMLALTEVLRHGTVYTISALIFVCFTWLLLSMCFTLMFGPGSRSLGGIDDEKAYDFGFQRPYFGSLVDSILTLTELSYVGLCWGEAILNKLFGEGEAGSWFGGFILICVVFWLQMLVSNLVLGIFVRKVGHIRRKAAEDKEQQAIQTGEDFLMRVRTTLDAADTNKDGLLNKHELHQNVLSNPLVMRQLNLTAQEVRDLFATMDTDGSGNVAIHEFIFGVLKIHGASKTMDNLSLDYRQKVLLRTMANLEKQSLVMLKELYSKMDSLHKKANDYIDKIRGVNDKLCSTKDRLIEEQHRVERNVAYVKKQALVKQQLADAHRKQEDQQYYESIQAKLDDLHAGIRSTGKSGVFSNSGALRAAVHDRLQTTLLPWLEGELAGMGLVMHPQGLPRTRFLSALTPCSSHQTPSASESGGPGSERPA